MNTNPQHLYFVLEERVGAGGGELVNSNRVNSQNTRAQSKSAKSSSSVLANTMLVHESSQTKQFLF